jgi:hypothetical protein
MDYTYKFEAHLREHRPSRLGQRLWWMPAVAGGGLVIADGVYMVATPSGQLSSALAVAPLFIAALLCLLASAALSIADWTYASEKHYREAEHAADSQLRAYILAGRRARGELPTAPAQTPEPRVTRSGSATRPARPRQPPAPDIASVSAASGPAR